MILYHDNPMSMLRCSDCPTDCPKDVGSVGTTHHCPRGSLRAVVDHHRQRQTRCRRSRRRWLARCRSRTCHIGHSRCVGVAAVVVVVAAAVPDKPAAVPTSEIATSGGDDRYRK